VVREAAQNREPVGRCCLSALLSRDHALSPAAMAVSAEAVVVAAEAETAAVCAAGQPSYDSSPVLVLPTITRKKELIDSFLSAHDTGEIDHCLRASFGVDRRFAFGFGSPRCLGPLFAASWTACLNRSQPSGRSSIPASTDLSDLLMTELFVAPAQKIARAKRHISEAAGECESFFKRRPYAVVVEAPPPTATDFRIWKVRVREPVPDHLPAVIGDAIHNLRSALDLLACDIVRHNGGNVTGVYLPFASGASELERTIKEKNLRRASPEAVALLRSMKPYRGSNADLRALHDLDIHDKHKGPIAVVSAVTTPIWTAPFVGPDQVPRIPSWISAVADGHWLITLPSRLSPPLGTEIPSVFKLIFAKGTALEGEQVIPTLIRLAENTASVVKAFQTLCLGDESRSPS
jgi:hypothetical protein